MQQTSQQRPDLLKLMCILTFIGSGLAAFSNLLIWSSFDEVLTVIDEYDYNIPELKTILSGGKQFFLAGFFLYTISLAGAIQMWKLNKIGFHMYTAAQLFILILPIVMIKELPFSFLGLAVTALFISGYFSQMRFMK